MKSFHYVITDELGIHARPAGNLVKEIKKLDSSVTIHAKDKVVDASRLMAVMGMGIKQGDSVSVMVEGGKEEENCKVLEEFFKSNL